MIPGKKENILFLVLINSSYSDILKIQIQTLHQTKIPHQAQKKFEDVGLEFIPVRGIEPRATAQHDNVKGGNFSRYTILELEITYQL